MWKTVSGSKQLAYNVQDNVLSVRLLHEARQGSGESSGVQQTRVGNDANDGKQRTLADMSNATIRDPDFVCKKYCEGGG